MALRQSVFPRNLGNPVVSTRSFGVVGCRTQRTQAISLASWADGANHKSQPWYRQTKETKCGGMGGRTRSALIVPTKCGNGIHPDRMEGSEAPDHGIAGGKHD